MEELKLLFNSELAIIPKVSILIPTFKRLELLEEALISALSQNSTIDFEVVVVDNDQSIETLMLIKRLHLNFPKVNLKLYQQKINVGLYGNWNTCLLLGDANWMTILSDDDLLQHDWLDEMWKHKVQHNNAVALACETDFTSKEYKKCERNYFVSLFCNFRKKKENILRKITVLDYFIAMPHQGCLGILFKRDVAKSFGGFNYKYHPCADFKLLSDIATLGFTYGIKKPLATYRTEVNISSTPEYVYLGLTKNKEIQLGLVEMINLKNKSILQSYINLFCARSILGPRKIFQNYPPIQSFIKENKVSFRFSTMRYIFLKCVLIFISNRKNNSIPQHK